MVILSPFVCKWFDKWFEARGTAWINTNQSPDALFLQILPTLNLLILIIQVFITIILIIIQMWSFGNAYWVSSTLQWKVLLLAIDFFEADLRRQDQAL